MEAAIIALLTLTLSLVLGLNAALLNLISRIKRIETILFGDDHDPDGSVYPLCRYIREVSDRLDSIEKRLSRVEQKLGGEL